MKRASPQDDITQGGRITPENMARLFPPQRAAKIKRDVLVMAAADPEGAAYMERLTRDDGGHRWFVYCLDTVARRTS